MPAWATRGHQRALATVARAVASGAPAHAWLVVGPSGAGKTTLATDLAAGLLCLDDDPRTRPCGSCTSCIKVAHRNHPDLHWLMPDGAGRQVRIGRPDASEPGTVRHLLRELSLAPLEGAFRVAIVEGAERLNEDAQNALLKTLEEPGAATCLVLCASHEETLLPTLQSRCARVRLGEVAPDVIAAFLVERGTADASRAASLARLSSGRPGRALALAHDPEAVIVHERLVRELLDLAGAGRVERLTAAAGLLAAAGSVERAIDQSASSPAQGPAAEDRPEACGEADATSGRRHAPSARRSALLALGAVWASIARDLALVARGGHAGLRHPQVLEDLLPLARSLEPGAIESFLVRLDLLLSAVDENANPELVLDVLLLEWPRPSAAA